MSDIVERLIENAAQHSGICEILMREAADEIKRLRSLAQQPLSVQ